MAAQYTILVREGELSPGNKWRQYLIVSNERVFVVHMTQAMFGWNIGRIDKQGAAEWPGMDCEAIVAWKLHDERTRVADDLGDFRERLISRVEAA